jgi:hypothetical protein
MKQFKELREESHPQASRSSNNRERFLDTTELVLPETTQDSPNDWSDSTASSLKELLEQIKGMLCVLVERQTIKDWYTVDEFARIVGKAEFTCREWARNGRIHAQKRNSGRGAYTAWVISHAELLSYQREGLLPIQRPR